MSYSQCRPLRCVGALHVGELPLTIDFAQYDHNPGYHNITIVAISTLGETDDFTNSFPVEGALIHAYILSCMVSNLINCFSY